VLKMVTLCVAHRPGYSMKPPRSLETARICPCPSPEWGISSSLVRAYLKQGYSCGHMLPESVAGYIRKKGLYGGEGRGGWQRISRNPVVTCSL
jgi:nicotinic acid mononucleotide adenylyltransferase